MTPNEVFQEFISMWDTADPNKIVTLQEFAKFFEDLSAGVDRDEMFEGIVRGSWHI